MGRRPGKDPLDREQQLDITSARQRTAEHRGHRILLTAAQPLEQRPVGADRALCRATLVRHRRVALVHGNQPSIGTIAVHQVKAHPASDLRQERLVPAPAKLPEELHNGVAHRMLPTDPPYTATRGGRLLLAGHLHLLWARRLSTAAAWPSIRSVSMCRSVPS